MIDAIDLAALTSQIEALLEAVAREASGLAGREISRDTVILAILGCLGVVLFGARWFARRRARRRSAATENLAALTRGPKHLGLAASMMFLAFFTGWSVLAPLASAALAPGVISPDGYRKTVQHLEGGIIQAIHIREGDMVDVGDPLITLDDTAARSLDAEIRERFLHVLATEARLEAERLGTTDIAFPQALLDDDSPALRQVMDGQRQLLLNRRATQLSRTRILESRILQLGEQNSGLREVIAAEEEQLALIDEEITTAADLLAKGMERKPRVLALQRIRAEIAATRAANRAKIAENSEAIGATQLQLIAVDEERREAIASQLADIRRVLAELKGQLPSRENILERTVIRAPIGGTVMNLRVTTEGGVIGPREPVVDIVPTAASLIVNARVQPNDIDRIEPGMSARVVLTAYSQRSMPLIHGQLQSISGDALIDERTGLTYFLARIEVDHRDLAKLSHVQLVPGMPAEVMLLDGEKSAFEYLLAPILESRRRSFVEK